MSFAERGNKRSARRFRLIGVAASCELHHRMGDVLCRGNGSVHQCGARRAARGKQARGARPRTRVVHKTRCGFYDRPSVNPGKVSIEPASTNREFAEAMSALQAGKLGDAERLCKAVLRSEPKHVEALTLLGAVLGRLGRNAEAVASFDRALAAAPNSVDAWYGRGMTLVAMNRPQQAIKSFDHVIAAEPHFSRKCSSCARSCSSS